MNKECLHNLIPFMYIEEVSLDSLDPGNLLCEHKEFISCFCTYLTH